MRVSLRRSLLGLALVLWGCASARGPRVPPKPAPAELRYQVQVDAALAEFQVEVCGRLSGAWIAGRAEAHDRLRYARWVGSGPPHAPAIGAGIIELGPDAREGCLVYGVSLHEGGSLSAVVARVGENLLASPNAFLWRPRRRSPAIVAELRLKLPEGMRASLPWAEDNGLYRLQADAFAFDSYAAFGPLSQLLSVQHGHADASVALLGSLPGLKSVDAEHWLNQALLVASQSDGRLPARALQILVVPGQGREPFGSVARGGGASVLMLIPEHFDAEKLRRDWVLPHELSHLLLPFVVREDAWLPEGLATYYQELLRARAGVISAEEALANLADGLRSAAREGTGRTLADESRAMHRTRAYRSVYWGGAGHLLMADVALRRRSHGRETLDGLLSALRAETHGPSPMSARVALLRLDALGGGELFGAIATHSQAHAFPDFEPTLQALGVDHTGSLHKVAPLAELRRALFAPQLIK